MRSRRRLAERTSFERVALVTGGGRGIGANVARALAEDGWSVVVAARTLAQVEAVAGEIGGRAVELDVGSPESVERAFAAVFFFKDPATTEVITLPLNAALQV